MGHEINLDKVLLKNAKEFRHQFRMYVKEHADEIKTAQDKYEKWRPKEASNITSDFVLNVMTNPDWALGSVRGTVYTAPLKALANERSIKELQRIFVLCQKNRGLTEETYAALVCEVKRVLGPKASPFANRIACYFDERLLWVLCRNRITELVEVLKECKIAKIDCRSTKNWFVMQYEMMQNADLLSFLAQSVFIRIAVGLLTDFIKEKLGKTMRKPKRKRAITCMRCETENAANARFCKECGSSLRMMCPKCGRKMPQNSKRCDRCKIRLVAMHQTYGQNRHVRSRPSDRLS
ncbi:MAG: zinc ribbon domain-containing protein [Kiritimatiellae bacterium]|nr:zinc ribbon domain-containing protein [Kiritimatiellia bacterium]